MRGESQRRDGGGEAFKVGRRGQAVVAVFDQSQLDIGAIQQIDQRNCMAPGYVGIAHALQDAHRAARIEGVAFEEMRAPLLDQMPGDGIRIGIGRGHVCDTLRRDLVLRLLRQLAPHQRLGHIEGRRDQHEAGELITSALAREVPREQQARSTHPWRSR